MKINSAQSPGKIPNNQPSHHPHRTDRLVLRVKNKFNRKIKYETRKNLDHGCFGGRGMDSELVFSQTDYLSEPNRGPDHRSVYRRDFWDHIFGFLPHPE